MITIYIAVDIGKRNCVVWCITDKDGSTLEETNMKTHYRNQGLLNESEFSIIPSYIHICIISCY